MGANQALAAAQIVVGGYVSIIKIIPPLLLLLLWARLLTWADKDAPAAHLPRMPINLAMLCGMIAGYALFFILPYYFLVLPLLVVIFGVEVGAYLIVRQQKVGLGDLQGQFQAWLRGFSKQKQVKALPGQVVLINKSGSQLPAPEGDSPDRPAYDATQLALTDPLRKGADEVSLDSRTESGALRYRVDCVTYSGTGLSRASAAAAISYLKGIAALDVEDRRKPQSGSLRLTIDGNKHEVAVQTAGSTAGEAMRLMFDPKKWHEFRLEGLGFTEEQLSTVKEMIADRRGIVLLSAPRGMGLTSLMYGVLRGHDAFLEHIQTIERDPQQDLDGITQNKLAGNASAAEEFKSTDWVISQEPDVILINRIEDPRSATELIKYAKSEENHRVYVGIRAGSTFEALQQWRKLVGDDSAAMEALRMVVNGRVLRHLCMACKVEFTPDPTMLRKLGMNPEKVGSLFQARTQPLRDPKGNPVPCTFCNDLHFKGRQGVFEIMVINDEMRAAVIAGKPVEPIFRRSRGRFLQDEALALVEKGQTSIQEVKRVMRPGAADADSGPPAGETPPAGSRTPPTSSKPRPGGTPRPPVKPKPAGQKR